MWLRVIIVIVGAVLFINGCNSLTSQLFGTHVLREYPAEQVAISGIDDADYVLLKEAWRTGDYYIVPPKNKRDRSVLVYPVLSALQYAKLQQGEAVRPIALAWTRDFDPSCDMTASCAAASSVNLRGVVRDMNKRKRAQLSFPEGRYELTEEPIHIEDGRAPIAWYWNVLMMLSGLVVLFIFERRFAKKRRKGKKVKVLE